MEGRQLWKISAAAALTIFSLLGNPVSAYADPSSVGGEGPQDATIAEDTKEDDSLDLESSQTLEEPSLNGKLPSLSPSSTPPSVETSSSSTDPIGCPTPTTLSSEAPLNIPTSKTGWIEVDGLLYYINADNTAATGWTKIQNEWYYLNPNTGAMVTGWAHISGAWYYLDPSTGVMQTGWVQVGNSRYFLNPSGAMVTGWANVGGSWYYLDPASGAMRTGHFRDSAGTLYIANSSGVMYSSNGWAKIGSAWYYLSGSGAVSTGWTQVAGSWYYLSEDTGAMLTGWANVGGSWYYLNPSGAMVTGWLNNAGSLYYLNPDNGKMMTGLFEESGAKYFANSSGIVSTSTWVTLSDGTQTYADSAGRLNGTLIDGVLYVDNSPVTGWVKLGNTLFYVYPEDGRLASGLQTIEGKEYYFDTVTHAARTGWIKLDNSWFFFNRTSGSKVYGWANDNGVWYYLLPDTGAMATGWIKLSEGWYWLDSSGAMATGVRVIDGTAYYFNSSGLWIDEPMIAKAQGFASNTSWLILVDTTNNYIGVFYGRQNNWQLKYRWSCTTGAPSTPTVLGQYTVTGKGYSFGHGYTCYYYTQFYGDYLFHSIKYYQGTFNVLDGRLGQNLSNGCVRLSLQNAKWVYDNIPIGTKVYIYR